MNAIEVWTKSVSDYNLPRWQELPELALYLDQVLEYIHEILNPIFIKVSDKESFLTAAMINNYVKHQLIPAPVKKRYHKDHLAFIISITVLKQVTNLANVSKGTRQLTKKLGKEQAYDTFVMYIEKALKFTVLELDQGAAQYDLLEKVEKDLLPLKMTSLAFASKMLAECLLANIKAEDKGEVKNEK